MLAKSAVLGEESFFFFFFFFNGVGWGGICRVGLGGGSRVRLGGHQLTRPLKFSRLDAVCVNVDPEERHFSQLVHYQR